MKHLQRDHRRWVFGIFFAAMVLFMLRAPSASAQSSSDQSAQVQQLQMKLSQVEKEMQELKQQIGSLQQQSQKPATATPSPAEEALHQAVSEQASAHVPLEQVGNAP